MSPLASPAMTSAGRFPGGSSDLFVPVSSLLEAEAEDENMLDVGGDRDIESSLGRLENMSGPCETTKGSDSVAVSVSDRRHVVGTNEREEEPVGPRMSRGSSIPSRLFCGGKCNLSRSFTFLLSIYARRGRGEGRYAGDSEQTPTPE
jgi:hypothetical protein